LASDSGLGRIESDDQSKKELAAAAEEGNERVEEWQRDWGR